MPLTADPYQGITITSQVRRYQVNSKRLAGIVATTRKLCHVDGAEVSVTFVGPGSIRRLNREWRHKDRSTDVLSFPQLNWTHPVKVSRTGSRKKPVVGVGETLGDVIISLADAERNAKNIGQGLDREVCFLIVHGFLHLCGHDHMNPKEEKTMLAAQRTIMKKLDGPNPRTSLWKSCVRQRRSATRGAR